MVYKFFKICSESDKKYIYLPKKIMRIKNSRFVQKFCIDSLIDTFNCHQVFGFAHCDMGSRSYMLMVNLLITNIN